MEKVYIPKDFAIATFASIDTSGNKKNPEPMSETISIKSTVVVLSILAVN